MKFEDLYPSLEEFSYKGDGFFKAPQGGKCAICKSVTPYVSVSFECNFCSTECNDQMWDSFWNTCRMSNKDIDRSLKICVKTKSFLTDYHVVAFATVGVSQGDMFSDVTFPGEKSIIAYDYPNQKKIREGWVATLMIQRPFAREYKYEIGVSVRDPRDRDDPQRGMKIAIARSIKSLSKKDRQKIWDTWFETYPEDRCRN